MDGDPFADLDAKYGIGTAAALPSASTAPAAVTPPAAGAPSGGDPYAALDAKYFGGGTQERTSAEQRSDKAYGPQSTASDIQQSAEAGVPKAVAGLIGLPSAIGSLRDAATAWSLKKAGYTDDQVSQMMHHLTQLDIIGKNLPTAEGTQHALETASGGAPIYEPQTGVGKFAGRAAEGVASMPGAPVSGILSGVLGEAGRQLGGTAGDIIGSLAGGGFGALANSLKGTSDKILHNALQNVTDEQFKQADDLVKASIAKGTQITGAEALSQVTGGNVRLQDMQRVLERTSGGAGSFEPIMQGRPGANTAAMEGEAGKIAPPIAQPSEIAPRVQGAAEQTVNQTRQTINETAKPFYQAAETQTMEPGLFASLQGNAMFQAALKKVRADPIDRKST